jgi:hypothetical protein
MLSSLLSSLDTPRKYLDNLHTVKNRIAQEKVDKKQLFIIRAKNSTRAQVLKLKTKYLKEESNKLNSLDKDSYIARKKAL